MKKLIKKWLDKLSKANKETFGTGRVDCCDLNKRKPINMTIKNFKSNK